MMFSSCTKNKVKSPALTEEQLVNLYADALVLRHEAHLMDEDTIETSRRLDSLYTSYDVSSEEFEVALQNHKQDLTAWKEFYGKVVKRLAILQEESSPKKQ
ncbi:MAG TPA: hypothetical protein VGR15_01600 [Bacteroidota bacterium]|jgi:hypothetical protein|nr:hypothetical protein [Bacteroidota bacterium]